MVAKKLSKVTIKYDGGETGGIEGKPPAPITTHTPHISSTQNLAKNNSLTDGNLSDLAPVATAPVRSLPALSERDAAKVAAMTPEERRALVRARMAKARAARKCVRNAQEVDKVGGGSEAANSGQNGAEAARPIKKEKTLDLKFSLSDKQCEALDARERYVLYGGAKGGGKSWFMCVWVFLMAMKFANNKIFFCRRRSVDFTNTTLETWKKSIPAQLYRIHEQKKKIFIPPTNSVVDYGGLDDPLLIQSLNSAEYAHIAVDQAEEIERDSFSMLLGTMRHQADGLADNDRQIRLTANPAQCWLKDYFITNPQPNTKFIQALPTDNPYLPKDYVDTLKQAFQHRPHLLSAYLHGSWDDLSGNDTCIRGSHIEEAKLKKVSGKPIKRVVVNDPAITGDENVTFLMEQCGKVAYIADELIIEHKRPIETAALLSAYRKRTGASLIAIDKIGIGEGVLDGLYELKEPVLAINSAAKPTSETAAGRYGNLRAQMWWEAGEKFARNEVAIPSDDVELARQLGSVKFDKEKIVKYYVQSKAEIKEAIGRSPDRADALIMGLYALDQAGRMDEAEYEYTVRDRVGYGVRVMPFEEEFAEAEDYSGYNIGGNVW